MTVAKTKVQNYCHYLLYHLPVHFLSIMFHILIAVLQKLLLYFEGLAKHTAGTTYGKQRGSLSQNGWKLNWNFLTRKHRSLFIVSSDRWKIACCENVFWSPGQTRKLCCGNIVSCHGFVMFPSLGKLRNVVSASSILELGKQHYRKHKVFATMFPSEKWTTCSGLMKTGLNNVLLPTLFNVVNNIEKVVELACN